MSAWWKQGERPVVVAAGLLGASFYFLRFGFGFLAPGRIAWLLGMADTAFNQLAWMFFRYDAWRWPPGAVKTFMAPAGTTIGVTDSLPLLAFPFKAISFLLPATFQYAGLWLLVNHVLMAVFAVKIAGLFWRPFVPRFLAAGLLALCPAWLIRDGHFALSALWVLAAALYFYLKPAAGDGGRPLLRWWLLLGAAAWIHPYPAVFTFLFLVADQGRRWVVTREVPAWRAVVTAGGGAVLLVVMWTLAGFLRPGHLPVGNLPEDALWSASAHALWDGQGRVLFMPAWPLGRHDPFEGFVYLGPGVLLVAGAGLVLAGRRLGGLLRAHWQLAVILAACAAYAFGPRTDLGDQLFRAQARWLWPHFFVFGAAGVAALAGWRRPRWPVVLLAGAFVLQAVDLVPLYDRKTVYDARTFTTRLQDPQWDAAMAGADLLLTFPASTASTVFADDFVDLTLLAHAHGVPTTAGFATRNYRDNVLAAHDLALAFLTEGDPPPGTVAVLRRSYFAEVFPNVGGTIRCTDLDGFPVCFAREDGFVPAREFRSAAVTLATFLAANLDRTLVLAGRGDATRALTRDAVQLLTAQGSSIARLPPGASYGAILVGGDPVFEQMNPGRAIEVTAAAGSGLGPVRTGRELSLASGGTAAGPYASLTVAGREVMFDHPGLNVAVLDEHQNVLAVGIFAHPDDMPSQGARTGGIVFTLEGTP